MKVTAFNCSPRKNGNSSILIKTLFSVLSACGIETETVQVGGTPIRGCTACLLCKKNQDRKCAIGTDILNSCVEKMIESDGIILASPTYFSDITAEAKALIDRAGYVGKANNALYRRKVGAALITQRRAGGVHAFDSINHFFLASEMIIAGSFYWNLGVGKDIGEVNEDKEGLESIKVIGENIAWVLKPR